VGDSSRCGTGQGAFECGGCRRERPYSFHSAQTLTPQAARDLIRKRAAAAVQRIADFKPHKLNGPVTLELSFKNYRPVEMLGYLPIVERVDSHTIRYRAADILQISKFLVFALEYRRHDPTRCASS
jgi:D-amino peptidase